MADNGGMPAMGRLSARRRVSTAVATGVVAFAVAMAMLPWQVASLTGWDVTALVFVVWVWLSVWRVDGAMTERLAMREDDSRAAADVVVVAASVASLVGVAFALAKAAQTTGATDVGITAVAATTVVLSWTSVQTLFTLRYARLYYAEMGAGGQGPIDFNGESRPDFGDFAYVAFTLGMTYQVSDTALRSTSIRRTVLRHALLSYLFGTFVVAMTINVVAGLISK